MKKYLVAGCCLIAVAAQAQKTPPKKTTPVKTVAAQPKVLKSQVDSVSYAIGYMVANFYKNQQGIKQLNPTVLARAVSDIYASKVTLLNEAECNSALMSYLNPGLSKNLSQGSAFLQKNKSKAGVKTTASGLQYEVITEGKGARPAETDTVTVHYAGTLVDGTEFESSYKRGAPATFPVGNVIRGWVEGLQLMTVGSKYRFFIPQELGYGMNENGPIPGGSALIFEIELLSISGK